MGSKGRRGKGEAGRTGKGGVEGGWGGLGGRVGVCCPGFPSQEGQDQLGGLTLISSLPLRFKGSREQRGCTHRRQRVHWMEPVLREIPWAQTPQGHLGPGFGHCPDSRSIKISERRTEMEGDRVEGMKEVKPTFIGGPRFPAGRRKRLEEKTK